MDSYYTCIARSVLNDHLGFSNDILYQKLCYNEPCYKEVDVFLQTSGHFSVEMFL